MNCQAKSAVVYVYIRTCVTRHVSSKHKCLYLLNISINNISSIHKQTTYVHLRIYTHHHIWAEIVVSKIWWFSVYTLCRLYVICVMCGGWRSVDTGLAKRLKMIIRDNIIAEGRQEFGQWFVVKGRTHAVKTLFFSPNSFVKIIVDIATYYICLKFKGVVKFNFDAKIFKSSIL